MPDQQDDMFLQRRLLLASVLSALALTAYVYVAGPASPPPVVEPEAPAIEASAPAEQPSIEQESPSTEELDEDSEAPPAEAERRVAAAEQPVIVETDRFKVSFSNRGAVVTSWILKNYKDAKGAQLDLVHTDGAEEYGYPFALALPGGEPLQTLNQALFVVSEKSRSAVTFEYSDEGLSARKSFRFGEQAYVVEIETEVTENGVAKPHLVTWNSGFGDTAQPQDSASSSTFYFDPATQTLERNAAGDAEAGRITNRGPYTFVGIDDLFFTASFLPRDPEAQILLETSAVEIEPAEGVSKEIFAALAVGIEGQNELQAFVGPKSVDALGKVIPQMREVVNFGWFGFVAEPLFWMLRWTYDHVVSNYGWAIVLVTVFINFALFPLKWKSMKSMKKMQSLQPLVKQINEKYKGLSMRDPKKAQQNEEMMALYKKHGVNPIGGCMPMLLQLPFFIGFYNVLTVAIELRHAPWLWVTDLSAPEHLPVRILPLAMVGSQFWQQSMTPTPTADPSQMRLMKFMPLMLGFIFYGFQSGLVLFWLTMNVVGVFQQLILNRVSSEDVVIEPTRSRRRRKKRATS